VQESELLPNPFLQARHHSARILMKTVLCWKTLCSTLSQRGLFTVHLHMSLGGTETVQVTLLRTALASH